MNNSQQSTVSSQGRLGTIDYRLPTIKEAIMSNAKVGAIHELPQEQPKTKEDLPCQAFAIVGDRDDPDALAVLM